MDISVNKRLIEFLKDKDYKQKELAEFLFLSEQQISKWFKLKEQLPEKHFIKIIKFYPALPARWFITGEGKADGVELGIASEPENGYGNKKDCCDLCREKDKMIEELRADKEFLKTMLQSKKETSVADSAQYGQAAKHGKTG